MVPFDSGAPSRTEHPTDPPRDGAEPPSLPPPFIAPGLEGAAGFLREREAHPDSEGEKKRKEDKKKEKRQKAETQRAEPWQRYKAMIDALKESQDLVDLADHKARFALIIMGALNAGIIIIGTRSDLLATIPPTFRGWLYVYFAMYAVIAIYFLIHAIESLRPRSIPDFARKTSVAEKEESLGLRFFVTALRYDLSAYQTAWQSVRVSHLNAELANQLYTVARINRAKYIAVGRLYRGLQAITLLTAGLLLAIGASAWVEHRRATATADVAAKIKAGKPRKGGWAILGEPERFPVPGVREPSGITSSATRGTFFVVGDEGSLVEVSKDARVVARIPTGGDLEDSTVHSPSGRLMLLSEKKGELLVFDPVTSRRTGRFKLDGAALLGDAGAHRNQGFEGVAFRPEGGRPGGGIFYLVHQRAPAMLIALVFDPLAPSGDLGAEALISRTTVPNRDDLTAVTYDPGLDRLFVIADSKDRLVMMKLSGEEEAEIVLPGAQQEGLAFDPDGNLWIADDRAGLLVFRGARARIEAEMKAPHPDEPPPENPPAPS